MGSPIQPRFKTTTQLQNGLQDTLNYFQRAKEGDLTLPSPASLKYISSVIDQASKNAYTTVSQIVKESPEHLLRVAEINSQPRTSGASSIDKAILWNASSFEQMFALKEWQATKTTLHSPHTFIFGTGENDFYRVKVSDTSPMKILLGTTRGEHKAPKYEEWAVNDPWSNPNHTRYIHPLENLEIVRQPDFLSATLLKGNPFEEDLIDQSWRYGKEMACVELKGQAKNSPQKLQSSGLNLTTLTKEFADLHDLTAKETNICRTLHFEDFSDEGYQDDAIIDVSPGKILTATEKTIVNQNNDDLNDLMEKLFIAKIGVQTTPALRKHIVKRLFD